MHGNSFLMSSHAVIFAYKNCCKIKWSEVDRKQGNHGFPCVPVHTIKTGHTPRGPEKSHSRIQPQLQDCRLYIMHTETTHACMECITAEFSLPHNITTVLASQYCIQVFLQKQSVSSCACTSSGLSEQHNVMRARACTGV